MFGDLLTPARCSTCRDLVVLTTRWTDNPPGEHQFKAMLPESSVCPVCGGDASPYDLEAASTSRYQCPSCQKQALLFVDTGILTD